jgi:hypothetical protein
MTITELLDTVKTTKGIDSDYALAKTLNLPSGHICEYYKGKRAPNEYACLQIARALGKNYEEVQAIVRIDAEKDIKRRQVWQEYYMSIGGYAASILIGLFLLPELHASIMAGFAL